MGKLQSLSHYFTHFESPRIATEFAGNTPSTHDLTSSSWKEVKKPSDAPSEQTKHQLTLMCSWFLQPLRGVKWFGHRKLLFASTRLPAAMQLSLA